MTNKNKKLKKSNIKKKIMKKVLAIILLLMGLIVPTILAVKQVKFNQGCEGYLKQAADASTPDFALERINRAIEYIESNNLTSGYTSLFWKTEDENIEFWYQNILACREELQDCLQSSQLEKTNVLMKVRESLTDNGEHVVITIPQGIHKYPHNGLWALLLSISLIVLIGSACYLGVCLFDKFL